MATGVLGPYSLFADPPSIKGRGRLRFFCRFRELVTPIGPCFSVIGILPLVILHAYVETAQRRIVALLPSAADTGKDFVT